MNSDFVIKVMFGGLGDHLFFSHLPRIAKSAGYARVLVSNASEFRHPEYRRLVWESNPFVDGFTDADAPYPSISAMGAGMNLLDEVMVRRGLDDGERLHEPEIFYQPKSLSQFKDAIVYDPNYVSNVGTISRRRITAMLKRGNSKLVQLKPRAPSFPVLGFVEEYGTTSVYDYCDVIASCKEFCCLASGGATLAAALGRKAAVFYGVGQPTMFHHSPLHRYLDASPWPQVFSLALRTRLSRIKKGLLRGAGRSELPARVKGREEA